MKRLVFPAMLAVFAAMGAAPAPASVLGPTKPSELVFSRGLFPSPFCLSAVEVMLTNPPAVGQVLVVTGFSWRISAAAPNSSARVILLRTDGTGFLEIVESLAVANAASEATATVSLQPGVVGLQPADGLTHLCISQNSPLPGVLTSDGSLQGYIAPDR